MNLSELLDGIKNVYENKKSLALSLESLKKEVWFFQPYDKTKNEMLSIDSKEEFYTLLSLCLNTSFLGKDVELTYDQLFDISFAKAAISNSKSIDHFLDSISSVTTHPVKATDSSANKGNIFVDKIVDNKSEHGVFSLNSGRSKKVIFSGNAARMPYKTMLTLEIYYRGEFLNAINMLSNNEVVRAFFLDELCLAHEEFTRISDAAKNIIDNPVPDSAQGKQLY